MQSPEISFNIMAYLRLSGMRLQKLHVCIVVQERSCYENNKFIGLKLFFLLFFFFFFWGWEVAQQNVYKYGDNSILGGYHISRHVRGHRQKTLKITKNAEKQCKIEVKRPIVGWKLKKMHLILATKNTKISLKAELSHPWHGWTVCYDTFVTLWHRPSLVKRFWFGPKALVFNESHFE